MKKLTVSTAVIAALISQSLIPILVSSADAASNGWRYWGYYQAAKDTTKWKVASTGPTVDIKNGAVEGWSFTFNSDDIPSTPPKVKADFAAICGKKKASEGFKRIGLVIDFGSQAYAPKGQIAQKTIVRCVETENQSQGIDVLGQVLKVRQDKSGLVCGINGYPVGECGEKKIPIPASMTKK